MYEVMHSHTRLQTPETALLCCIYDFQSGAQAAEVRSRGQPRWRIRCILSGANMSGAALSNRRTPEYGIINHSRGTGPGLVQVRGHHRAAARRLISRDGPKALPRPQPLQGTRRDPGQAEAYQLLTPRTPRTHHDGDGDGA
jgi:hypothetical protein